MNGIEDVISRPDLGDRAIFLTLAPIAEADRRSEAELWREFEVARPRILGALLDAVVHGLGVINQIHLDGLPRMADFARWAAACETAFWPAGTFAHAYAANRRAAIESIIEADPVATCVRKIMGERTSWTGSAADLLRLCAESARGETSISPPWGKKSALTCGATTAYADVSSHVGYRDCVRPRRAIGRADDQNESVKTESSQHSSHRWAKR